jgi:hypothetical protein
MMSPVRSSGSLALVLAFALGLSSASPQADAALQTIVGSNFDLVYDDASTGLFGTPNLSGTTIFFTPSAFAAQSLNGAGTDTETSPINFTLVGKNGFGFGGLLLVERGDYLLSGAGSSVSVGGQLVAFDVADPIGTYSFDFITPTAPLNVNNGTLKPWTAVASLDLNALPFVDPRSVGVTLQNFLSAVTVRGTVPSNAFVQKKSVGESIMLQVLPVPEPSTWAMLAIGMVPFLGFARRR